MLNRFRGRILRKDPGIRLGYYEAEMKIAIKKEGPDSDRALVARGDYAAMLHKCGETEKALAELASVIESMNGKGWDVSNYRMYESRIVHAKMQLAMGNVEEAERENRVLLQECVRVLGDDDLRTLQVRANYAAILFRLNRLTEAEVEISVVVEKRGIVAGFDDPKTLHARSEQAKYLASLGRDDEAMEAWRKLVDSKIRLLGEACEETLEVRDEYARFLYDLGRREDAAAEYKKIELSFASAFGADHPDARRARQLHDLIIQEIVDRGNDSPA